MANQDVDADDSEHERRKESADKRIGAQRKRMNAEKSSREQKAKDQLLMNEMRGNKATVELNRALHDYDNERRGERDS